jgi:hypothetical protein
LREIRPPKKKTPNSGANIGAIAGELLKELLEYDNLESNVIVPTLLCLGPHNQGMVRNFVHALLPSNIRLFEEGNSLYPVRENCCAAMLQYYLQVQRELGYSNVVTSKMREIANLINLSDSNFPNLSPALVVAEWSKIIAKDVSDRKLGSITAASADLHAMSSTLNQLTTMVGGLQADLIELKEERRDLATVCAAQECELVQQRQTAYSIIRSRSNTAGAMFAPGLSDLARRKKLKKK